MRKMKGTGSGRALPFLTVSAGLGQAGGHRGRGVYPEGRGEGLRGGRLPVAEEEPGAPSEGGRPLSAGSLHQEMFLPVNRLLGYGGCFVPWSFL